MLVTPEILTNFHLEALKMKPTVPSTAPRTLALALGLLAMGTGSLAFAHTTSLGFLPGLNPGEVTFWTGSYSHGGIPVNEGTGTLTGVSVVFNQSKPFNIGPVGTKPAGLVDGTNNFFWGQSADPNFTYEYPLSTDPNLFGGVVWWQGVTFTGLVPGVYDFTCGLVCGVTAQWDSLANAGSVKDLTGGQLPPGTVRVTLTAGNIGGGGSVPEPGILALLGVGVLGMVGVRRRSQTA